MAEKKINPVLKQVLELGPPLLFILVYFRIKEETYTIFGTEYGGFIVAAAAFVPLLVASIAALWFLTGTISRMQVFTVIMVVLFGSLTVWFNDEKFFKMKTTLVYSTLAGILGIGLLRGKSYLAYVMRDFLPMKKKGYMILTRRLTAIFVAFAVINEIVWRTMSDEFWVVFEGVAMPAALMVFLFGQIFLLQKYFEEDKKETA